MGGAIQTSQRSIDGAHQSMPAVRSLLMVDCGSVYTKVALLDTIDGRYRLLARAQTATTTVPPAQDVTIGVREAIGMLEHTTGHTLLRDGQLITPEQDDGSGVDGMTLAATVGGPLRLLATGPGRDALAGLLHRAIGGFFVQLDALPALRSGISRADPDWYQALAQVRALHPHAMLIIGSPFGSARGQGSIEETATTVAMWLDALREPTPEGPSDQPSGLPVVFTGNPPDVAFLSAALQGHTATLQQVEALLPSTLASLSRAVSALYERSVLRDVPGYAGLRNMSATAPTATNTALGGLTRYLAQHFQTNVVGVDIGASSTSLVGATANGELVPAEHPNAGVSLGAGYILRSSGAQNVLRWVSAVTSEDELREYALTCMLRPRALPATPRELEMQQAFAREAIRLALHAPGSRLAGLHPLDVVLGTGGVLANVPHPAMAALILLDALQPRGVTSMVLDTAHISNMLGSIAALDSIAAAEVAESDAVALQLGTVISTNGIVPEGEFAVRVVLEYSDGRRHVEDITQGTLLRLPLPPGERAILGLYPAPSIDVGLGPGQQAQASEPLEGGALGLIVDARGRPLALPTAPAERIARLVQWRRALGLEVE